METTKGSAKKNGHGNGHPHTNGHTEVAQGNGAGATGESATTTTTTTAAAAATTPAGAAQNSSTPALLTIPVAELTASVDSAIATIDHIEAGLSWQYSYPASERSSNTGRWRTGEDAAARSVLRTADQRPDFFGPIAHLDGGSDPNVFETAPSWDNLARRDAVVRLVTRINTFAAHAGDSTIRLGDAINQVVLPAYQIARNASQNNENVRSELSDALEFHGHAARQRKVNARNADAAVKKQIKALRDEAKAELNAKIQALLAQSAATPAK